MDLAESFPPSTWMQNSVSIQPSLVKLEINMWEIPLRKQIKYRFTGTKNTMRPKLRSSRNRPHPAAACALVLYLYSEIVA